MALSNPYHKTFLSSILLIIISPAMENTAFSRSVDLDLDPSANQLSARAPKEIHDGSQRALFKQLGKWGVQSNIVHLHQGTCSGGEPASIIAFDFRFRHESGGSSSRFAKVMIKVTFASVPDGTELTSPDRLPPPLPVVKRICPKLLHGPLTSAKETRHRTESVRNWPLYTVPSPNRWRNHIQGLKGLR
jgi:hypothetical protein